MLVILGGPQRRRLTWISAERRLIKELLQRNVPILAYVSVLSTIFGSHYIGPVKKLVGRHLFEDNSSIAEKDRPTTLASFIYLRAQRLLVIGAGTRFWCQQM